jgi:hypothetical protein
MNAEQLFREAFERLKENSPQILEKGTPISQNNVAREAGCDPSALRKSRYPKLIAEIKAWSTKNASSECNPSDRQRLIKQRSRNRSLAERLTDAKKTSDLALSKLVEADAKILELSMELDRLRAQLPKGNVKSLKFQ